MRKKLIAILVMCAVLCSLTACGSSSDSSSDSSSEETSEIADLIWPEQTINIVCCFSAGGDTDYNARLYAEELTELLGVTCVVTNVTGNGGATGAQEVYDADPDGYTVLVNQEALYVNYATGATDFSMDGFELSCVIGKNAGNVVCVSTDSEYETLDDLVEASKTDNVTFAANVGATTQVMGTLLNVAGAEFNLVDMGGTTERVAALMGGQVDAIPNAVGTVQQYVDSGDFRALCILEDERSEALPDVPTAIELGYDASFPLYYYFAFPEGTDQAIVDAFADACEIISEMEEVQDAQYEAYAQTPFFLKGDAAVELEAEREASVLAIKDELN